MQPGLRDEHGGHIPYSAEKQLEALKAGVARIAGNDAWVSLQPGVLPEVTGRCRPPFDVVDGAGREWRRVYIVGLRDRNLVAIAWSQPAVAYNKALLDEVLAALELPSAPEYRDGDLHDSDSGEGVSDYSLPIPGHWVDVDRPPSTASHSAAWTGSPVGASWSHSGRSMARMAGVNQDCRLVSEQTTLDELAATIRDGRAFGPSTATTLGGEPAVAFGTDTPVERRYAVALHDGRPVAVMVDVGDWDVAPGIVETMLDGFRFSDRSVAPVGQVFTTADGAIEFALPDLWSQYPADNGIFFRGTVQRMTVRVGDADGTVASM